jgi:hypothetical protein
VPHADSTLALAVAAAFAIPQPEPHLNAPAAMPQSSRPAGALPRCIQCNGAASKSASEGHRDTLVPHLTR